jgi:hypothetical protein
MTNKKPPTEASKPRSVRLDTQVSPKAKGSTKPTGEVIGSTKSLTEAQLKNKISLLEQQQVKVLKDIENLRLEVAYYQHLWETTEDELLDMENESWCSFTLYRIKRWFKEIFECEPS